MIDKIAEKQRMRHRLQVKYQHACERAWELRTKVVAPEKEALRRKFLTRLNLEKRDMCLAINALGDEIFALQREDGANEQGTGNGSAEQW